MALRQPLQFIIDNGSESGLVSVLHESFQQLAVAKLRQGSGLHLLQECG
jgi:hypothetical protein